MYSVKLRTRALSETTMQNYFQNNVLCFAFRSNHITLLIDETLLTLNHISSSKYNITYAEKLYAEMRAFLSHKRDLCSRFGDR